MCGDRDEGVRGMIQLDAGRRVEAGIMGFSHRRRSALLMEQYACGRPDFSSWLDKSVGKASELGKVWLARRSHVTTKRRLASRCCM